MKWIGNLINGLLVAALGAIVLAYIQPLVQYASPDVPLKATIESSRWIEKPSKAEIEHTVIKNDPVMEKLYHQTWMSPEQEKFLAVLLSNDGKETVKDFRMRFDDKNERPTAMIISNDGLDRQVVIGKSNILLPDMKPGENLRVYLWADTAFPRILLPDNLKLFSSAGQFQITYLQPQKSEYFIKESPFFKFVDKWIAFVFVALVLGAVVLLIIVLNVQEAYYKKLLKDIAFHAAEKVRYDVNPSKFTPTL